MGVRHFYYYSSQANCVLPLPRTDFIAPLIFAPNGTLLPTDSIDENDLKLTIPSGGSVTLSCAPKRFKGYKDQKTLSATCKNDQTLGIRFHNLSKK